MSFIYDSLSALRSKLSNKELSPKEVLDGLFEKIEKTDPTIQGYLSLNKEAAYAQAEKADVSLPLGGVPLAIKDLINVKGQPCGCASKFLKNYEAKYDASVIKKLKEAGAILVGRTNMDEFAMGSSTENSAHKTTRNPWNKECIPGGSSGGSAAVVAAHEAFASLGSDTGGSIRQPAALCGCVGMKPTYGRISRYGLVAFASSLDQIGPFTKTVEDSALLLEIMSGHDRMDNTSSKRPVENFSQNLSQDVKGLKIGIAKEYFIEGIDKEVEKSVKDSIRHFEKMGAEIVDISLPHTEYATAVYYIIATAEASANLARFDGVRYGSRIKNPKDVLDHYKRTRAEGFGEEVKRRIILGTYVLSSGYYDAYYHRAQKVRQLIRTDFEKAFEKCDIILTPTSPTPAFKIGERINDPLQMYLADVFTIAVNLAGNCALSLPCGFTSENLPIGLQIIGSWWNEKDILRAAHAYEQSTPWHEKRPPNL